MSVQVLGMAHVNGVAAILDQLQDTKTSQPQATEAPNPI
jgi:hypothetical protein